jgi:hypothetical protein
MTIRNFNNSFVTLNADHRPGITGFLGKSDESNIVMFILIFLSILRGV